MNLVVISELDNIHKELSKIQGKLLVVASELLKDTFTNTDMNDIRQGDCCQCINENNGFACRECIYDPELWAAGRRNAFVARQQHT